MALDVSPTRLERRRFGLHTTSDDNKLVVFIGIDIARVNDPPEVEDADGRGALDAAKCGGGEVPDLGTRSTEGMADADNSTITKHHQQRDECDCGVVAGRHLGSWGHR